MFGTLEGSFAPFDPFNSADLAEIYIDDKSRLEDNNEHRLHGGLRKRKKAPCLATHSFAFSHSDFRFNNNSFSASNYTLFFKVEFIFPIL